ncbi:MAG: right-handed parallel beta-helix repeat-containing protein, partial [Candidatus Thermoplasmatota archaeon]|nr:right-handed parallel beta-helix repeat-containing protein [Candidatus Thermoplasmatota archaeon]
MRKKFGAKFSKTTLEFLAVVIVSSLVIGALSTVLTNTNVNTSSSYTIWGYVSHPYVERHVHNATVLLWNLRTNETNVTYTDKTGYYYVNLNDAGMSWQTGDEIRILTYYMHYSDNRTITVGSNSSNRVDIKLRNNNHFNNYNLPELNFTVPEYNETNLTEPELPDFENYTYPENSTKRLPNLTVSDISYDKLILGNQTQLNITSKNINNETAYNVTAEVYYESNNNELLATLSYGDIVPNETKTGSILWTPIESEINNLKITIYAEDQKENTMIIGFYVWEKPMGTVSVSGELPAYLTGDVIIDADAYTGPKDVLVEEATIKCYGNLEVTSSGTLTFKKNVKLIMVCHDEYGNYVRRTIQVNPGGRFEILAEKGDGSVIRPESWWHPFAFDVYGSLSARNARIFNMTSLRIARSATATGVCWIEDSLIAGADTHNIYSDGGNVTIRNSVISHAGEGGDASTSTVGCGIYLENSANATLDDAIINNSIQHGIYAYRSGVYITGSEITENNYGIYLYEANPDVKIYTDCLADGSHKKEITFTQAGEDASYLTIPKDAEITSATLDLSGNTYFEDDFESGALSKWVVFTPTDSSIDVSVVTVDTNKVCQFEVKKIVDMRTAGIEREIYAKERLIIEGKSRKVCGEVAHVYSVFFTDGGYALAGTECNGRIMYHTLVNGDWKMILTNASVTDNKWYTFKINYDVFRGKYEFVVIDEQGCVFYEKRGIAAIKGPIVKAGYHFHKESSAAIGSKIYLDNVRFASDNLLFEDGFETDIVNKEPKNFNIIRYYPQNPHVNVFVIESEGNKILKFVAPLTPRNTDVDTLLYKEITPCQAITHTLHVKPAQDLHDGVPQQFDIGFLDATNTFHPIVEFCDIGTKPGEIRWKPTHEKIDTYSKNNWYRVQIEYNLKTEEIKVYINDVLKNDTTYPKFNLKGIAFGVFSGYIKRTIDSTFYVDNVKVEFTDAPTNIDFYVGENIVRHWYKLEIKESVDFASALDQYIQTAKPICGNVIVPLKI